MEGEHCHNQLKDWALWSDGLTSKLASGKDILFSEDQGSIAINTETYGFNKTIYLQNDLYYGADSYQAKVKINLFVGFCWRINVLFATEAPVDPLRNLEYIMDSGLPV